MNTKVTGEEKNKLIIEYANLALKSAKNKQKIDEGGHRDRAKKIRTTLDMSHKTICCLATHIVT